jgi:hypothetical protein
MNKDEPIILENGAMRVFTLAAICAAATFVSSFGIAQVLPLSKPVPELGYKVSPDFFQLPPNWIEGEAAGVAVNSKGHIFLFQRNQANVVGVR